ncbi:MAG: GNAT family N-acetyltransferase [Salaquimonas sp.]|nr:GNAT family N-acetyltransferase [Salaquimonas sp.]
MLPFETERLIVRNWRDDDRDLFFAINSDERVMEFFPFRRNRRQSDELMDRLRASIEHEGFGFSALELRDTGECIGFCAIARATMEGAGFPADMIEIGWRLHHRWWGKGYASEAARAWLTKGFEELGLDEIVSFAVHNNHRSTAVMERIGLRRDPSRDFDHPGIPDTHPHLKRHVFYTLTREEWLAMQSG